MGVRVSVTGVPEWIDPRRLLTDSPWSHIDGRWVTELTRSEAADLQARLRGVALGGRAIEVQVRPSLKRALVRSARTADARRRRQTTPGFTRRGTRLDDEGKMSLTAEAIALELGERAAGQSVLDCCGGCGGNAIGFARAGCEVTLVEPNAKRIEMARHNARLYGVEDRIRFVRATAQEVAASETADLLFADPPWGSDWNRAGTGTSDLPLLGTLLELADRFEHTWLKLPPSFDVEELPTWRPSAWFGLAEGDWQRVKFLLLTRRRRLSSLKLEIKGGPVSVRRIGPGDRERLSRGLGMLSEEGRLHRFHAGISRLSSSQLRYLTEIDQHSHIAWGAEDPGRPDLPGIAVVRAIELQDRPGVVEFAIAVADAYQGRGLGTMLMGLIALDASQRGHHSMIGRVRPGNDAMLQLLDRLGASRLGTSDGSIEVLLDLSNLANWPDGTATARFRAQLPGWPTSQEDEAE